MEHSDRRWLNRTPIRLHHLEQRLQPGSLLCNGLDISPVADLEPSFEISTVSAHHLAIRRIDIDDSPVSQIGERTPQSQEAVDATPTQKLPPQSEVRISEPLGNSSGSAAVKRMHTSYPPALRLRAPAGGARAIAGPLQQQPPHFIPSVMRKDITSRALPQPISHELDVDVRPFDTTLLYEMGRPKGGGKAADYHTYDGTPFPDANNAVASGKGPETGVAYAVGFQGLDGSITKVDAFGGFLDGLGIVGAVVNDIATDYDILEIPFGTEFHNYVVGNLISTGESFILRLEEDLNPITAIGIIFTPPAGGSISFEGVGVSPNGATPDVYIAGWFDAGPSYASVLTISYDDALTAPIYSLIFDYGTETRGTSVDADRPRNAYYSMVFDDTPATTSPATMRVSAGGGFGWAVVFPAAGLAPTGGMFGTKFIGGVGPQVGVYATGIFPDDGTNPGMDNLLIAKFTAAGAVLYGIEYFIPAEDFAGMDVVVDRDGEAYTAGYFTLGGDMQGTLNKFDAAGAMLPDSDFVGAPGFPDSGRGIDLVTTSPTSDVLAVGDTSTPAGLQHPAPVGFDVTYDGAGDGYILRDNQPLTP